MVRKSVTGFRLENLRPFMDGRRFYSDAGIDRIIEAAGGLPPGRVALPDQRAPKTGERTPRWVSPRKALAHRLEKLARAWAFQAPLQTMATHRQQADACTRIESAAKRLLVALGVGDDGDVEAMSWVLRFGGLQAQAAIPVRIDGDPGPSGETLLRESVLGVVRLRQWATKVRERADALATRNSRLSPPAHAADEALMRLIEGFREIGVEIFGKRPGTSVGKPASPRAGKAGGPMVRFIQACLKPLNIGLTDEAVRERVRPPRGMGKSRCNNF